MRTFFLITASLIVALLLALLPLPHWATWWWPKWVVLVAIYWALMLPGRFGIVTAWLLGLLLDIIQGTLLGEQAFALAFVTYLVIKFHAQIRQFMDGWRMMIIFLIIFMYQIILFALQSYFQNMPFLWQFWVSAFTSALIWPWTVYPILKFCQQRFRVVEAVERRYTYTRS